ncbi:hypothetical protein [Amycolatopsis nalaikhensis]|uniref:WXG100 family type VII secretion target n=1 Tax=Amycolatopsis nalaikhensis TaxID=715472 RepID=A0ABY8XUS9_9PSEU|nr:hypothetical protein [Amycolatopsis sp. 2-2]WIV59232.1 hypothetical protein QP939_11675 [Amycolatopsis sp. 2-2]
MAGFFYDGPGMTALKAQLDRLDDDFGAAKKYVDGHTDLSAGDQGLIMYLIGPHQKARDNVLHAVAAFEKFTKACSTAVGHAEQHYEQTESQNRDTLAAEDAKIRGAGDPANLQGLSYDHDKGLLKGVSWHAFTDVNEPTNALAPPEIPMTGDQDWSFDWKNDAFSPSAYIRDASRDIAHRDVFDEATALFAGKWGLFAKCAEVWTNLGLFFDAAGDNMHRSAADTPTAWRGNAADAAEEKFVLGAKAMKQIPDSLGEYAKLYGDIVTAVKESFGVIEGQLTCLVDAVVDAILAGAIGAITAETVIGAFAGASVAGFYVARVVEIVAEVVGSMDAIKDFVDKAAAILDTIKVAGDPPKLPTDLPGN